MKNVLMGIVLAIFTISGLSAQWTTSGTNIYNSNTGNVGIATTTPLEKLHVQGGNILLAGTVGTNTIQGTIKFSTATYPGAYAGIAGKTNSGGVDQIDLLFYTAYSSAAEKMRLMAQTGYLGIGTSAPSAQLHVISTGSQLRLGYDASNYASFTTSSSGALTILPTGNQIYLQNSETYLAWQSGASQNSNSSRLNFVGYAQTAGYGIQAINTGSYGTKDLVFYAHNGSVHADYTSYDEVVRFTAAGNVGIGTSTPVAKLSVNGNVFIGAQDANTATYIGSNNLLAVNGTAVFVKAKVAVYGPTWPDYVFAPNYKLTPLDSLEQFIQLNKHLPEVPSADDVQKDGIDLGNNQALLLKKIEELTLIVIDQNKKQEDLEKKINKQEDELAILKNQLIKK